MCCRECKYYNYKRGICMFLPLGYTDGKEIMVPSSLVDIYSCKEYIPKDSKATKRICEDITRGIKNEEQ